MSEIEKWGPDAADNNLTVPDGAPDNWYGKDVNEWGREVMASVRLAWQYDEWRDIVPLPTGNRSPTRESDTEIRFPNEDLSDVFFVGQRIRVTNSGATSKLCVISAVTFSTHTDITVVPDPETDGYGETQLGTGESGIVASTGRITDDSSGSDATPYDDLETGDVLRLADGLNVGFYTVTKVSGTVLDLVALGDYVMHDETATLEQYWLDVEGVLPATDVAAVEVAGAHTDNNPYPVVGTLATNIFGALAATAFGDAAFMREADMDVADADYADDADTVDEKHYTDIRDALIPKVIAPAATTGISAETELNDLDGITFPITPDGSQVFVVDVCLQIDPAGGSTTTLRCRKGTAGDKNDDVFWTAPGHYSTLGATYNFRHRFVVTPAAGEMLTFTLQTDTDTVELDAYNVTPEDGSGWAANSIVKIQACT